MICAPVGAPTCESSGEPTILRCYRALPRNVQSLADKSYALLKANPGHPSLHFKKVGQFWSARVWLHYRALAVESGEELAWFWIGSHSEYDKLVAQIERPTSACSRRAPSGQRRNPRDARAADALR